VARSVYKGYIVSEFCFYRESSDRLSNEAKLLFCNACFRRPKGIKQSGFAMVDVSHDCHNRCPFFKVSLLIVFHKLNFLFKFKAHQLYCFFREDLELVGNYLIGVFLDQMKQAQRVFVQEFT
jgi:hypothetical protein